MTREEKEHIGKYILKMAKLLEDGCYQQEILLGAVHIIDESLKQEPTTKNDLGVDAVNRKAVHDMIENLPITVEDKWFNWLQKACMRLAEMPSVTPQESKTGHWIMTGDYYTGAYGTIDYVECSCCHEYSLEEGNYCPHCGAKMVEPQESEDKE